MVNQDLFHSTVKSFVLYTKSQDTCNILLCTLTALVHLCRYIHSLSNSDVGTLPPESCVFGQLMNIAAVLSMTFTKCSS